MEIGIASDHAGFDLKVELVQYLEEKGYTVKDFGPVTDDRVDYPDFAHPLAKSIEEGHLSIGFLMCGSGNGISMAANKHQGIRAAIAWKPELAALAKQHNNANILSLPARFITVDEAKAIVDAYLSSEFEGGRHAQRVDKIPC